MTFFKVVYIFLNIRFHQKLVTQHMSFLFFQTGNVWERQPFWDSVYPFHQGKVFLNRLYNLPPKRSLLAPSCTLFFNQFEKKRYRTFLHLARVLHYFGIHIQYAVTYFSVFSSTKLKVSLSDRQLSSIVYILG